MAKNWSKWIPAVAVPIVVIAAGAIVVPLSANAAPNLPSKTPEQVLALLAGTTEDSFSGTVAVTSDLGLPSISTGGSGSDDANLDLLTGTHDARVYVDGASKVRAQVLDQLAERDVVRNGTDVWLYNSDDNAVEHSTVPAKSDTTSGTETPASIAKAVVATLEPSSSLSVATAQTIAGRDAYTLVLEPKATDTLVGSIAIAVDAKTGLPLSVSATARGANDPAWQVQFSKLDLATPSASLFEFTPPADATVTEHKATEKKTAAHAAADKPTVTGTGWDAVVSVTVGDDLTKLTKSQLFTQLSTAVDGGRLISTSLVNVLVTTDGKVLAGSVPVATLQDAAR